MRYLARLICGLALLAPIFLAAPALGNTLGVLNQSGAGVVTGSSMYVKSVDGLNAQVDYAVFAPGYFLTHSSSLIANAHFVDTANPANSRSVNLATEYIYAYEIFNLGLPAVTLFSVDFNSGTVLTGRGVGAASIADPGVAATILVLAPTETKYEFGFFGIMQNQHSELLFLTSLQPAAPTLSYMFFGGYSTDSDGNLVGPTPIGPNTLPAPTPATFLGGSALMALLLVTKFARRAC